MYYETTSTLRISAHFYIKLNVKNLAYFFLFYMQVP